METIAGWVEVERSDVHVVARQGAAARVTFCRPAALNAFDDALGIALRDTLAQLAHDDAVRCVVLTGEGRAFSAGADVKRPRPGPPGASTREVLSEQITPIILSLREMAKPVIAAVNGPAAGVGCSIAVACDLVIAAESSYFLLAFANIGLSGDGGATITIPARVGFGRASVLTMLAERLPAPEALSWGLADRVVADDELETTVTELALRLAAGPTGSYARTKRALNAAVMPHLAEQLALETELQCENAVSADYAEGVAAFVAKRAPVFRGA